MKTFLHVGYPKCGSSFLQTHYFVEENHFFNLTKDRQWRNFLYHQLLAAQSSFYVPTTPPLPDTGLPAKFKIGVSSEDFMGDKGVDYAVALSRFKDIFPDTKVLIVIRNQQDLVFSNYIQMVKVGYTRSIDTYLKELRWDAQQSIWGKLYFDKIFQTTKNVFDDVLILPYEYIFEYEGFVQQLNNYFERKYLPPNIMENVTSDQNVVAVMRILSMLFRHGYGKPYNSILPSHMVGGGRFEVNNLQWERPSTNVSRNIRLWSSRIGKRLPTPKNNARKQFQERYRSLFEEHFSDSNYRLNEILQFDLGKYDYVGTDQASSSREA